MHIDEIREEYQATVGSFAQAFRKNADAARGDPAKAAQAVLRIASEKEPPLRLLLGSDAVFLAGVVASARMAEDAKWKALSVSTDFDGLVWSTLPDVESLTGGRLKVLHFTGKARVNAVVRSAGFARHTFVEAPFYFQNLLTAVTAQPLPDGGRGWAVPMDPALRVIHAGDVTDVGRTVAAAFGAGDALPNGSVLAVAGGRYSWNDFAKTLNALGHHLKAVQVPADVYDRSYPGAHEVRETFQYFAEHTYFGPQHEAHIRAANALVPGGFTSFADWARMHMKP